jgi:hypothetical protein
MDQDAADGVYARPLYRSHLCKYGHKIDLHKFTFEPDSSSLSLRRQYGFVTGYVEAVCSSEVDT